MMEALMNNWLVLALVSVLLAAFKKEIGNFLTAWNIYRLRALDIDGNPDTSDRVQILCSATGKRMPPVDCMGGVSSR